VIIAPPSTDGGFIAAGLLGGTPKAKAERVTAQTDQAAEEQTNEESK
jgi:hypothetical protein